MAISTIGNTTYINQNMQTISAQHANATQRGDFIPQEFEDKLKEIEEVRPTEENQKIDKDSPQHKQEQEKENHKSTQEKEEKSNPEYTDGHLLNIRV